MPCAAAVARHPQSPVVALMPDMLFTSPHTEAVPADPVLLAALEQAAGALARLDQALDRHPHLAAVIPPG